MKFTLYALVAVALSASGLAMPAPTPDELEASKVEMAKRTYTSGKTGSQSTCYYSCPEAPSGYTLASNQGHNGSCKYNKNGPGAPMTCTYSSSGGGLTTSPAGACPLNAATGAGGTCDSTYSYYKFKRDIVERELTNREKIIKARQFDPKKARDSAKVGRSFNKSPKSN